MLDDFSARRLKELPSIADLRAEAKAVEWRYLAGRLLETYTRRDLDILRAAGDLSRRELSLLGRLDAGFDEHAALEGQSDLEHCAHCGEDITRARRVIEIELLGTVRRYHGARPRCAGAAGWLYTGPGGDPRGDAAEVISLRGTP